MLSMAEAPYICGKCACLIGGELSPTHGRHRAAVLFGLRHSVGNCFQDSRKTAVAPHPFPAGQIGPHR